MPRKLFLILLAMFPVVAPSMADSYCLNQGALAAHHVPMLPYSTDPPPGTEGFCPAYEQYAIGSLSEVNARIDVTGYAPVTWYVIASWDIGGKEWCGVEFGLGDYPEIAFDIREAIPCFPDQGLEIPGANWPGPNSGTAIVTTTESWTGNWRPVYCFGGYAYDYGGPALIPLGANPATGFVGFSNCLSPPNQYEAPEYGLGAMGVNRDGVVPDYIMCTWGACCLPGGGCVDVFCDYDCWVWGGTFYPVTCCEPDPCPPVPTEPATWGRIKSKF